MAETRTFVIETHGGQVYLKMQDIAERYGLSKATVRKYKNEIASEIGKRYSKQAVITVGNLVYINEYVWLDYLQNADKLREANARKYVEPFKASDWAQYLGYFQRPIREVVT